MRQTASTLGWVALAVVLGGWFTFLRPPALGGGTELVVVNGTSMRPTYAPGDVVITRRSERYAIGDVVTYSTPGGQARVIHRIVGGGSAGFATKGDNRSSRDPWTPATAHITGRAQMRLPGFATGLVHLSQSPLGLASYAGLASFLIVVWPDLGRRRGPRRGAGTGLSPHRPDDAPTSEGQTTIDGRSRPTVTLPL